MAVDNEMISRFEDSVKAEFLYDKQVLPPNLLSVLEDKVRVDTNIEQMF